MKDRLSGIPKLNERSFIGNFHEFCLSIIRSRYSDIGFAMPPHIFDETDCKKILEEVLLGNPILKEIYDFPDAEDAEKDAKINVKTLSVHGFYQYTKTAFDRGDSRIRGYLQGLE